MCLDYSEWWRKKGLKEEWACREQWWKHKELCVGRGRLVCCGVIIRQITHECESDVHMVCQPPQSSCTLHVWRYFLAYTFLTSNISLEEQKKGRKRIFHIYTLMLEQYSPTPLSCDTLRHLQVQLCYVTVSVN